MPKTKKNWSESFGIYGSKIRVAEREPGGNLYALWVDNQGRQRKRSLGHRDRNRAKKQAVQLAARLASKTMPGGAPEPLSLREGVALALRAGTGMYPSETRHVRESRRLVERALALLGEGMTWDQLTPARVQNLVRDLARQSRNGQGRRTAEYLCDVLYGVGGWLREEGVIPEAAAVPRRNWKVRLKQEWETITGTVVQVQRPRHSLEEVARIFASLTRGDPRLELLIELAAELRAGQAVRAKRTDLELNATGGFGLGRFTVRGKGRKAGEVVDLHPELHAVVCDMLHEGYLSDAEIAYQQGDIPDYNLFPAGRLKAGKALVERCVSSRLGEKSIRTMFHDLERLAGVTPQKGRAFYGLRRQATDMAPDFATDDRVLDRLTGHLDGATRKQVYQDRESDEMRARAAKVRQSMRQRLRAVPEDGLG
ncbi:MAG: hypothetical protein M3418_02690 [Gemmatimonadota bacterium]|nr:hypothetical protein [Gemmatimonadota bacterium]